MQIKQKAFSLIEILIVMAVFLTAMLVVSDIFLNVSSRQNLTIQKQKALSDLQYTFEKMISEMRVLKIDYPAGGAFSYDLPYMLELPFVDEIGNKIVFTTSTNCLDGVDSCIVRRFLAKGNSVWQEEMISSTNFKINFLRFYLEPRTSPYVDELIQVQPNIVILLEVLPINATSADQVINLQTGITSRYYDK